MKYEIAKTEYFRVGKISVICLITLQNGYEVVATATKPFLNDSQEEELMGIAYQRAMYKLVELEGFAPPTVSSTNKWAPTITL